MIEAEATEYIARHSSSWPVLTFNWDLSSASQRYSMDGLSQTEFERTFPNGVVCVWIDLVEFDEHLCHASKRNGEAEVWDLGDKEKLAYLIAYLAHGSPITPPMVAVTPTNEFHLQGGNHRYIAAKASGVLTVPIYMTQETVEKARALVNLRDCP